ncbi:MAG: hypothetical protein LBT38_04445 [Deltaproteobacteria bacterium]|jgi:hypothetical protein|nr:hypothetical protein [Deltaproteobacteria bacterium]
MEISLGTFNEYKQLMTEHGNDLMRHDNAISYGKRALCVKKVQINLFYRSLYAFIMLDLSEHSIDLSKSIIDNDDNDD